MKVLAVDHGSTRVGLAVSVATVAMPLDVIPAKDAVERIAERSSELGVDRIVVGLPLRTDGSEGPEAAAVRAFAERVEVQTGLPVTLWDERLTSVEAERAMAAAGSDARARRGRVDQVAATILLQAYLEAQR